MNKKWNTLLTISNTVPAQPRKESVAAFRILTGHDLLAEHLHRLNILSSPMYVCIFGFKGTSTSKVIGVRNEMMMDDYGGQMIFGDLVGLKIPDIHLIGEEKPQKNLIQETCPDLGSNPGPLRDKRACYHLFHCGGLSSPSCVLCGDSDSAMNWGHVKQCSTMRNRQFKSKCELYWEVCRQMALLQMSGH